MLLLFLPSLAIRTCIFFQNLFLLIQGFFIQYCHPATAFYFCVLASVITSVPLLHLTFYIIHQKQQQPKLRIGKLLYMMKNISTGWYRSFIFLCYKLLIILQEWLQRSDLCSNNLWIDLQCHEGLKAFPMAQQKGLCLQCRRRRRHGFNPRVRKIPWKRKWQPTPVFLLGKSHGQMSLAGCSSWGHKE